MNFQEYQNESKKTSVYKELGVDNVLYLMTALTGEIGEVAEKIKKTYRDNKGDFDEERKVLLQKEFGDVLWCLSQLCTELGISFDEVATSNIEKVFSRKERDAVHVGGDIR